MQDVMKGLDSYEHGSISVGQQPTTPNLKPQPRASSSRTPARERHESHDSSQARERSWNKSHPDAKVDLRHSLHGSNSRTSIPIPNGHSKPPLPRTGSSASANSSADEGRSSRSSVISQTEYREHIKEMVNERDHEREREREGNKRHSFAASSSHSPTHHGHSHSHSPTWDRQRTFSHPIRPGSALSLHRHESGSASPSSIHSRESEEEEEIKAEIVHERERNWNAPRPKWQPHMHQSHQHMPSPSPTPSNSSNGSTASSRQRTISLKPSGTPKGESPVHRNGSLMTARLTPGNTSPNGKPLARQKTPASLQRPLSYSARPSSPLPSSSSYQRPLSYPARPRSPIPPRSPDLAPKSHRTPLPSGSRNGSLSSIKRKPSEPEKESPQRPVHSRAPSSPTPSARSSVPSRRSLIPVSSPSKSSGLSGPTVRPDSPSGHSSTSVQTEPEADDDDDPLAQENTPTLRTSAPLPVASPEQVPLSRLPSNDEARLAKAISSQPISPPSSPSEPSSLTKAEPLFSLPSTPPRRPSFASKLEFQTPSPPRGLPDLPGPPSEDEEDETTPNRQISDLSTAKTPKPPGGWAYTPIVPKQNGLSRANSLPPEADSDDDDDSKFSTPTASLSRAASMPPQTPALPGGWMNTPLHRKSVRFEAVSDLEMSTSDAPSGSIFTDTDQSPMPGVLNLEEAMRSEPSFSPKSPRRAATVRILDEFGVELEPVRPETPRSKSIVRIVDAMGREVEPNDDERPSTRREALFYLQRGFYEIGKGLDELQRPSDVRIEPQRIKELEDQSSAAREARSELLRGPLRASMRSSKLFMTSLDRRAAFFQWRSWTFFAIFSICCLIFLSWLSTRRARQLFLTTYYDPFYHDLYLHMIKPEPYGSLHPDTTSTFRDVFHSQGLLGMPGKIFNEISILISRWQRTLWDSWGEGNPRIRWPPT
ncbi:hypothetical protein C8J56DRAFT_447987 [Mycena floridula]|nr:hypothetical protein C8J56DRAFT_447987 [Mycena floridula]